MLYTDYKGFWPWPNFTPREVACRHCGELWATSFGEDMPVWFAESMDALQDLRDLWGAPIVLTSAHRCILHNAAVGGTASSQHLKIAFDCVVEPSRRHDFVAAAEEAGFTGIGERAYRQRGFIHLDLGAKRRW